VYLQPLLRIKPQKLPNSAK